MSGPLLPLSSRSHGKRSAARRANGSASLVDVLEAVRRRAQSQGFVLSREIRDELAGAGLDQMLWKDVVTRIGAALDCRRGRYYYVPPGPSRMRVRVRRDYRQQRRLAAAVRFLIRQKRALDAVHVERRLQPRVDFVCPVQLQTEERRVCNLLSRDISVSGIRLIGTRGFQGQKVHVWIPRPGNSAERCCFLVHMLWSATVADGMVESGGIFLDLVEAEPNQLKVTGRDRPENDE
jgi:hypothetical protein